MKSYRIFVSKCWLTILSSYCKTNQNQKGLQTLVLEQFISCQHITLVNYQKGSLKRVFLWMTSILQVPFWFSIFVMLYSLCTEKNAALSNNRSEWFCAGMSLKNMAFFVDLFNRTSFCCFQIKVTGFLKSLCVIVNCPQSRATFVFKKFSSIILLCDSVTS